MGRLAIVAQIVWEYFLGFDLLIFIIAGINAYCYFCARRLCDKLHKTLHLTVFLPEYALKNNSVSAGEVSESDLVEMRKRANSFYSVFINLTGIFPLLGILGTVISLIPMVADLDNAQLNFFTALTSTFWGLVFAIIYKFLDGFLGSRMDENNSNISLFLERNKKRKEAPRCETGE